ncbi:unnamed protein product [Rodentolepis nana]|uniref:SCP domain-containing protein n=1 Tax=Rodentolepis nana TaxID=102285 RepID=A0A0R3TA22_RODNA|nr:unnamed protein product [Rodentolepis nana]
MEANLSDDNLKYYQFSGYTLYNLPKYRQVASGILTGVKEGLTSHYDMIKSMGSTQDKWLDTKSGESSPIPTVGYIGGMWVACELPICRGVLPSNRVRYVVYCEGFLPSNRVRNGFDSRRRSAMSESATVHCFSVVRALSSLNLEVWKAGYIEECHCPLFLILGPAGYVGECHCPLFLLWGYIGECHCPLFLLCYIEECHCPLFLILG